jgi:hypothetical protein
VKHRYAGIIVGGAALTALALAFYGLVGYVALNTRHVADQVNVASYKPSAAVTEQISRTGMTAQGKFLYLASRPTVEDKAVFNSTCIKVTGHKNILGCYLEASKRAYVYHVTDTRLDGTEEVVAAHEMLRAAWDRMSPTEQAKLTSELARVLGSNTDADIDLGTRIGAITSNNRADRDGELYAIIGTEVPDAGAVLEKSYSQYFTNRSVVTALSAHARAYIVALNKKVAALSTEMNGLVTSVDSGVAALDKAAGQFEKDVKTFNSRAETPGGFPTQSSFDVARAALVARLDKLKQKQKAIKAEIAKFDVDLDKLTALNKTAAGLFKNLNDDVPTLPDIGGSTV